MRPSQVTRRLFLRATGAAALAFPVVTYAHRRYAGFSINRGGNPMSVGQETWSGPQTDWGKLDATHPPQRNQVNHFAGLLTPGEFTLDAVESPRNSNWFLVLLAARRALTCPILWLSPSNDFNAPNGNMAWRTVNEFSLSPSGETVRGGQKIKVLGKAWQGPREIRNLRWEGGIQARQRTAAANSSTKRQANAAR